MSNPPACRAPPVPAPRTKIRPIASVSPPGNLSKQGQPTTSPHPITSPTSSTGATSHKAKPAHPWMSIVHSGPWTKLPPAPSPFTPPRSGSLPATHKGWFKPRVIPPNPFEEAGEDTSSKARQKASKKPANQTEPSEPMSQSKNDSSAPTEKSDVRGKPSSRDDANAASVLGANSEASSSDEPAPSETPPCEDPPPPSAQTDGSAASSPGAVESSQDGPGEPPATAAGLPEGLGDTPNNLAKQGSLASGSGVTDVAPTSMDPSNIPGLGSLTGDGPLSGLVEGDNPLGSLNLPGAGAIGGVADMAGGLGMPGLAEMGSLGVTPPDLASFGGLDGTGLGAPGLLDMGDAAGGLAIDGGADITGGLGVPDLGSLGGLASSVAPPDFASVGEMGSLADMGSGLGVPGVPDMGECPVVGGLMESALPGVSAAALGLPSIPKSSSVLAISSDLKGQTTPSQSKISSPKRGRAPGYGFPPIKRTGELGEVNKRLEELELGSTQLEKNLRDCNNEEEVEAMLMDWMALIQEKHMLARRDAEITHLTKQKVLEERQADLEYKLRCLLIKPKSEWSPEDSSQEQQMMDELLSVVEQRNQIVSSLDEDRQREKEEDSVLEAMQEKEIQKKGLKELKKSRGKFKALEVFRMLSGKAAQESTPESKDEEN